MKNRLILKVLAVVIGGGGGYLAIENYSGTDIVLPNGTTIETQDITRHPTKVFGTRKQDQITGVVWHHAAWETQDINRIADWHVNGNNWAEIGYHGAINKKGDYLVLNELEEVTYHSGGSNTPNIGIVFMGDYSNKKLNDKQVETAKRILDALCLVFDIEQSKGHRDMKATTCPGDVAYQQLIKENIIWQ